MSVLSFSLDVGESAPRNVRTGERLPATGDVATTLLEIETPFRFLQKKWVLSAICDGFGDKGRDIATFAAKLVAKTFKQALVDFGGIIDPATVPDNARESDGVHPVLARYFGHAMQAAFNSMRLQVSAKFASEALRSGTSLLVVLGIPLHRDCAAVIVTASVGDAAALVVHLPDDAGRAPRIQRLAIPNRATGREAERIVGVGGTVQDDMLFSEEMGMSLDISRAVGADGFRPALLCDPYVGLHYAPVKSMLLAYSAGVNDAITTTDISKIVLRSAPTSAAASAAVIRAAWRYWKGKLTQPPHDDSSVSQHSPFLSVVALLLAEGPPPTRGPRKRTSHSGAGSSVTGDDAAAMAQKRARQGRPHSTAAVAATQMRDTKRDPSQATERRRATGADHPGADHPGADHPGAAAAAPSRKAM